MFEFLFVVVLLGLAGKLLGFALRAAWGLFSIVCSIVLLPLTLVALLLKGLFGIAVPLLAIYGIWALLTQKKAIA